LRSPLPRGGVIVIAGPEQCTRPILGAHPMYFVQWIAVRIVHIVHAVSKICGDVKERGPFPIEVVSRVKVKVGWDVEQRGPIPVEAGEIIVVAGLGQGHRSIVGGYFLDLVQRITVRIVHIVSSRESHWYTITIIESKGAI